MNISSKYEGKTYCIIQTYSWRTINSSKLSTQTHVIILLMTHFNFEPSALILLHRPHLISRISRLFWREILRPISLTIIFRDPVKDVNFDEEIWLAGHSDHWNWFTWTFSESWLLFDWLKVTFGNRFNSWKTSLTHSGQENTCSSIDTDILHVVITHYLNREGMGIFEELKRES